MKACDIHPLLMPIEEILEHYNDCHSTGPSCTMRRLNSAGIYLVQDFLDFTERELLCIPRMGRKRLKIITTYLARHGHTLRDQGQFWPTPEEVQARFGLRVYCRDFNGYDQTYGQLCWENIQAWVESNPPRCYTVREDL